MKKTMYSIFCLFMVVVVCCIATLNLSFSRMDNNEKIILSDSIMKSSIEPTINNFLKLTDTVVRGQIIDIRFIDVELRTGTDWDEKMIASGGLPTERVTEYTVKITDTILGNLRKDDIIKYRVLGDMNTFVTKPDGSKEICIFTKKTGNFYNTVGYENGIFEIDEDDKVYSFSNINEFSKFDNVSYATLKESIQQKYVPILRAKMYNQIQEDNMVTK